MKLASWNVNSLNVRLTQVLDWLETNDVDVLALQETKVTDEVFPAAIFQDRGYFVCYSGQKTYNGVAVISRFPLEHPLTDLQHYLDPQRRILAVTVGPLRLINLYVPNGASVDSDKYLYKMTWLEHITHFIKDELNKHAHIAIVGDFNIAPEDSDVHDPLAWEGQVLVSPKERQAFTRLLALGLVDSFRTQHPDARDFSWWDYRAAAFRRNHGLRIDHILLNHMAFSHCIESAIDPTPRRSERPSDHTPVWVTLEI